MKRFLTLLLTAALCLSIFSGTALAANPFTDVPARQWYYSDVINAYEMGLINGKTATTFQPNDNLTYAEAVKLAACMNQRYATGAVTLKNGSPWYKTYVEYCKLQGIIAGDYMWDQPATRAGYMEIFANALPEEALKAINEVPDGAIPDVSMKHPQAAAIYKLYRAGILQGSDAAHNCNPAANIKRCEVAAILTRMMDSEARILFSMGTTAVKPLKIVTQPKSVTSQEGAIASFMVEAEGGTMPYQFEWFSISNNVLEPIAGIPGVEIFGDSTTSIVEITVGGPYDWTTNEPFFCIVTDAKGYSVSSNAAEILLEQEPQPLTIDYESPDVLLSAYRPSFTVTFSGGCAPYVYIWEIKMGRTWVNMKNLSGVEFFENGTELTVRFTEYAQDECTIRCVIFDSLGNSVTSRNFEIFLN